MKKVLWFFLAFLTAFLYLLEHSTTVRLTFTAHKMTEERDRLRERVEELRIKDTVLSSAKHVRRRYSEE